VKDIPTQFQLPYVGILIYLAMRTNGRVSALVVRDNKILLIHRFKHGDEYWVIPGGGVEDKESLEESLKREVREETSLDLISFELLGSNEHEGHIHYFYKCELTLGEPKIGGPELEDSSKDNIYLLEWISIEDVNRLNIYPSSVKLYIK